MRILAKSAILALLICNPSDAASIEDLLTPLARDIVNQGFPTGIPCCTDKDLQTLKAQLSIESIPNELQSFFMNFGHKRFTCMQVVRPQSIFHNHPTQGTVTMITEAWKFGVSREYLPFCYDNADYYCIHLETGQVRFWSYHELAFSDNPRDMWDSFNDWVVNDWIPLMKQ
ncbi:SMI1/KNR4 family protein [Candidatus Bodocaedibacter vickermanii]|uniref:SMI1/KNR4 family protein n=1 Tax=Candidatus Bodocaedibacter vickermanii TaxID=2741701 RepID=A0A7L9RSR4_9PROT|nr:SMI1/KNR4 family protein [Candidatus Paracaedibacteraceae bacterium 'Lake Konstanz']